MRFFVFLLAAATYGQAIKVSPPAPVASAGNPVVISVDRPVIFSLSGAGTISTNSGNSTTYTAPSRIAQPHVMNGCMVLPADSVFNTRIDNLPVHSNSASWVANAISSYGLQIGEQWGINVIDNTVPLAPQTFHYTIGLNGAEFPQIAPNVRKREGGTYTTDGNNDHHVLSVNYQSCQFYETYQDGPGGPDCPGCTAASGWTYNSTTYEQPNTYYGGGTTDAAGLPLAPLTVHLDEIKAGVIKHPLRFTSCTGCISSSVLWPAVGSTAVGGATTAPMGARFRLKASFDIGSYPPAAQVVLTALKEYGMFLADIGTSGQITFSSDVTRDNFVMNELGFLVGVNGTNFEVVDESSLMLHPLLSTVKPNNPYVQPTNSAVLTITDAANHANVVTIPVALQPVTVGTPEPALTVQAGTNPFPIKSWVNGTSNQALTWSISPDTGAGTIGPDGTYTAPPQVSGVTKGTITLTSVVDPNATASIALNVIPAGVVRIDAGTPVATVDQSGALWLADTGYETGSFNNLNDSYPWNAWGGIANQAQYDTYKYTWGDDIVYRFHVPNGNYQITALFGMGGTNGTYSVGPFDNGLINGPMHLEAQGQITNHNWDLGLAVNFKGRTPATVQIPAKVTDTNLTFAVRAVTNTLGTSVPMLNAFMITPDSDAPHIAIDNQQIHVVTAGAQLQLYPVDWFSGSKNIVWSVVGPGRITPMGLYIAPLKVTTGQYVTVKARDSVTGLSATYFLLVPAPGTVVNAAGKVNN